MVNDIVDGVVSILFKKYGITVYKNKIPQNFREPCFFVKVLTHSEDRLIGKRYKADTAILIQYIDDENTPDTRRLYTVLQDLDTLTEVIELKNYGQLRSYKRKGEVTDGNIQYQAYFSYFGYKYNETDKMEELQFKGGIKN